MSVIVADYNAVVRPFVGIHRRHLYPPDLPVLTLHVLLAPFAPRPPFSVLRGGHVTTRDYDETSAPRLTGPRLRTASLLTAPRLAARPRRTVRGWFPRSPDHGLVRAAPGSTPARAPRLRRRPSPWPPHRWNSTASKSTPTPQCRALQTGPHPLGWSRLRGYRASGTGSLALHLRPSSTSPHRLAVPTRRAFSEPLATGQHRSR